MILKLRTNTTNALAVWKLFHSHGHVMWYSPFIIVAITRCKYQAKILNITWNIEYHLKYWISPETAVLDFLVVIIYLPHKPDFIFRRKNTAILLVQNSEKHCVTWFMTTVFTDLNPNHQEAISWPLKVLENKIFLGRKFLVFSNGKVRKSCW